jgi:hypothetical protein
MAGERRDNSIDELSRVIGRLEARVCDLGKAQEAMRITLTAVEKTLTGQKIKLAGLAASISGAIAYLLNWLRG